MIFSYNWLKEFVPEIPEPKVLLEQLTLHSVEVEGVTFAGESLMGVIVGIITEIKPHPKADRLQICMVDVGGKTAQIICGGSNIAVGMKVAVAQTGAKVKWHGAGELITLTPATIRGVESDGMICASDEIGLLHLFPKASEKEIVDLSKYNATAGTPLAEVLGLTDYLIDIDNKSMTHRSDLFCHRGLAREIAAVFKLDLVLPPAPSLPKPLPPLSVKVEQSRDCPRYLAAELTITIQPTPQFISERLQICGIKSINNVVDIANYCMLEYGQPMHAFDANKLSGDIQVRLAKADETIAALDHTEKKLTPDVLVIADQVQAIAVAGVIGGMESAVTATTTRVILEVANFDPITVRKGSQRCGVHTDSVLRYEKGLPPQLVTTAAARAIELLQKYAQAKPLKIMDVMPSDLNVTATHRAAITVSAKHLQRMMGMTLPTEEVAAILTSLDCTVDGERVSPPWYRLDLNIPEDIVEEIVRIYGVENVPEQVLTGALTVSQQQPELALGRRIRQQLCALGLTETYNYSFYGEALIQKTGLSVDDHIAIANPLSDDQKYLRTTLLPRLLETVARNQMQGDCAFFEVGHVYFPSREVQQIAIVLASKDNAYRKVRGHAEALMENLNVSYDTYPIQQSAECHYWNLYQDRAALLITAAKAEVEIGTMAELNLAVAQQLDIKVPVAFAVLSIPVLEEQRGVAKAMRSISPYPSIPLDLSLIVDETTTWQQIETVVRNEAKELLQSLEVFDVYHGEKIPFGKKSLSFHMILQSLDRTLAMVEIEQWRDKLVQQLNHKFGAELRAK